MQYAVVDGLKVTLNAKWALWVEESLAKGVTAEHVALHMAESLFTVPEIRAYMGERYPENTPLAHPDAIAWRRKVDVPEVDYKRLCQIALTRRMIPQVRKYDDDRVQLYMIDDMLSPEQCEKTVDAMRNTLRPSTVTYDNGDEYFRTSQTCYLSAADAELAKQLDQTIAAWMGIHPAYAEGIQAQLYGVGEEFKPHKDAFDPWAKNYPKFGGVRGNRTWTCMIYLQDVPKGGGTQFTKLGKTFYPKRGMALAWNNLHANGWVNYDTEHWGMPVEEGEKAIITKWFRERPTLSMFTE